MQLFEGTVIRRRAGGVNENFTVRRISGGVGVERTFLLHSPIVDDIQVVRHGKVRRAKLYYLRDRVGPRGARQGAARLAGARGQLRRRPPAQAPTAAPGTPAAAAGTPPNRRRG